MKNTQIKLGLELTRMCNSRTQAAPSEYTIKTLRGAITVYGYLEAPQSSKMTELRVGDRVKESTAKLLARDYDVNVTEPRSRQ